MTDWKFYKTRSAPDIPERNRDNPYLGYVYALEYGNHIKIGSTLNPKTRLKSLESTARLYSDKSAGLVMISPPHKNYAKNEKILHAFFKDKQVNNSELFEVTFDEIKSKCPSLEYNTNTDDNEQRSESLVDYFKRRLLYKESAENKLFDAIYDNPERSAEFYGLLSAFSNLCGYTKEIEHLVARTQELLELESSTPDEIAEAIELNRIATDLIEDCELFSNEVYDKFKSYLKKYNYSLNVNDMEVAK